MLFFHQRMQLRRQILPHFGHMNIGCLFGILLSLASCNQIPSQRPLEEGSVNLRSAFAAAQTGQNDEVVTNWLQSFQDPQLTRAVQTALANNQDLQSAAILLKSARQGTIIGRASRLPTLNASGNSSLSRSNGETNDSYGFSLNASWEPDVWGRLRDLEVASVADYHAAVADYRSARLSLAINTAQSWCDLITAESQLTLAVETLKSFRKNYQIIQRGYKLGTLRPLDDAFGRSNVADAEGSLKSSQLARDEAARNLQILMGQYPDAKLISAFELPRTPRVRAGLPSGLLARRPDLTARRLDILASAKVADAERRSSFPASSSLLAQAPHQANLETYLTQPTSPPHWQPALLKVSTLAADLPPMPSRLLRTTKAKSNSTSATSSMPSAKLNPRWPLMNLSKNKRSSYSPKSRTPLLPRSGPKATSSKDSMSATDPVSSKFSKPSNEH